MNLGELETLTNYGIPVKVLLLNNQCDGMVRQWQDLFFQNRYSGSDKSLHKKDFIKATQADGFAFTKRISKKEDLRAVLEEFVKFEGPAFVEAMIDQKADVFPMVPAGMGYKDMITGSYIAAREVVRPDPKKIDPSGMF